MSKKPTPSAAPDAKPAVKRAMSAPAAKPMTKAAKPAIKKAGPAKPRAKPVAHMVFLTPTRRTKLNKLGAEWLDAAIDSATLGLDAPPRA